MTKQEQDKNWDNLSQENKEEMKAKYAEFSAKSTPESKGYCKGLANVLGEHNLNPALTYEDVMDKLYEYGYFIIDKGDVEYNEIGGHDMYGASCCVSERQGEKILAINMLLNVAKFLNKNKDGSDWVPDWKDTHELKYFPFIDGDGLQSAVTEDMNHSIVYFRTDELFDKAVQILGEDVVRTALTTKY